MKVGILAVQGAVSEHTQSVKNAMEELNINGYVIPVRDSAILETINGLIIPGGESSTISRLIDSLNMRGKILRLAKQGTPIMGTCAGTILLAKEGDMAVERSRTKLLGLMDMNVSRNAFGRQRESFELSLNIHGIADDFPGVFIRAPAIVEVRGDCKEIAQVEGHIVAAKESNILALTFHPELTTDTRMHQHFLKSIENTI